jgi:uncharacterized protein
MSQNSEREKRSAGTLQRLREQLPWEQDEMRILSIDGGGIRGVLPARVLALCEERFTNGRSAGDFFDYIAGTSTGGIIALGLSIGLRASEILKIYVDHGGDIFPEPLRFRSKTARWLQGWWHFLRHLRRYKYDRTALHEQLSVVFGDRLFGEARRRLVVPSFDEFNEVHLFKTPHHPDYKRDWQTRMVDVSLSTSAAPTFLATYKNGDRHFADGGVWANNPIMTALVDALACYQIDRRAVSILSLGCVESEFAFTKGQMVSGGIWHWREIISAAMRLQSQNALGQAGLLVGRDHILRVDGEPMRENPIALDDYRRAIDELLPLAEKIFSGSESQLRSFFETPRPEYAALQGPRSKS